MVAVVVLKFNLILKDQPNPEGRGSGGSKNGSQPGKPGQEG